MVSKPKIEQIVQSDGAGDENVPSVPEESLLGDDGPEALLQRQMATKTYYSEKRREEISVLKSNRWLRIGFGIAVFTLVGFWYYRISSLIFLIADQSANYSLDSGVFMVVVAAPAIGLLGLLFVIVRYLYSRHDEPPRK